MPILTRKSSFKEGASGIKPFDFAENPKFTKNDFFFSLLISKIL